MSALQEQTEFRIGEKRVESKMSDNEKKLGLHSVVSVSVGLVIATSCLVSLGQGAGSVGAIFIVAMIVACLLNMTTIVTIANLYGVDMFAKLQDVVAFLLVGSMVVLGLIGMFKFGTGQIVSQPYNMTTKFSDVIPTVAIAFWLFIGAEYVIPVSKNVKNAKRNVPLGMIIGLVLICVVQAIMVLGFHNYTPWNDLLNSAAPHLLYGENLLGKAGRIWMTIVSVLAVVSSQNSTVNGLSKICQGMAKMNMMPRIFAKTNKKNVPWFGVIFVSVFIFVFAKLSDGSSDAISFLILVGSVFWIKFKMKMPVFKSVPLEKVMAMENSMYYTIRKRRGIWR